MQRAAGPVFVMLLKTKDTTSINKSSKQNLAWSTDIY